MARPKVLIKMTSRNKKMMGMTLTYLDSLIKGNLKEMKPKLRQEMMQLMQHIRHNVKKTTRMRRSKSSQLSSLATTRSGNEVKLTSMILMKAQSEDSEQWREENRH